MSKAWQCDIISMHQLQNEIYKIFLEDVEQVEFVVNCGPWNFDNNLVVVCQWKEGSDVASLDFSMEAVWIHIVGFLGFVIQ